MIRFIFTLIIILITNFSLSFGQEKLISFNFGYGKTTDVVMPNFDSPFQNDNSKFIGLGLGYDYKPKNAFFRLKSGLSYDYRKYPGGSSFNYIRLPIGFDFIFGKRIQPYFGFGFFGSYLFHYEFDDRYVEINTFQLGLTGNIGIEFKISEKFRVDIGCQRSFDLSSMYTYQTSTLPHPGIFVENSSKGGEKYFTLGIKYQLKVK